MLLSCLLAAFAFHATLAAASVDSEPSIEAAVGVKLEMNQDEVEKAVGGMKENFKYDINGQSEQICLKLDCVTGNPFETSFRIDRRIMIWGKPTTGVWFKFVAQKLKKVSLYFDSASFKAVRAVLEGRYGKPSQRWRGSYVGQWFGNKRSLGLFRFNDDRSFSVTYSVEEQ